MEFFFVLDKTLQQELRFDYKHSIITPYKFVRIILLTPQ